MAFSLNQTKGAATTSGTAVLASFTPVGTVDVPSVLVAYFNNVATINAATIGGLGPWTQIADASNAVGCRTTIWTRLCTGGTFTNTCVAAGSGNSSWFSIEEWTWPTTGMGHSSLMLDTQPILGSSTSTTINLSIKPNTTDSLILSSISASAATTLSTYAAMTFNPVASNARSLVANKSTGVVAGTSVGAGYNLAPLMGFSAAAVAIRPPTTSTSGFMVVI